MIWPSIDGLTGAGSNSDDNQTIIEPPAYDPPAVTHTFTAEQIAQIERETELAAAGPFVAPLPDEDDGL